MVLSAWEKRAGRKNYRGRASRGPSRKKAENAEHPTSNAELDGSGLRDFLLWAGRGLCALFLLTGIGTCDLLDKTGTARIEAAKALSSQFQFHVLPQPDKPAFKFHVTPEEKL